MIAADTSSWVVYLGGAGSAGADVEALDEALLDGRVVMPPVVLTELLSDPAMANEPGQLLRALPLLSPTAGYFARTGELRAQVLGKGSRARVADALIAQTCLDHRVSLITRDEDFRSFLDSGLRVAGWE